MNGHKNKKGRREGDIQYLFTLKGIFKNTYKKLIIKLLHYKTTLFNNISIEFHYIFLYAIKHYLAF